MKSLLSAQYDLVLDARKTLLHYCTTISQEDLLRADPDFGGRSIRNMLVHICNTYQGWLANLVPGRTQIELEPASVPNLEGCIDYFNLTNDLVSAFVEQYDNNWLDTVELEDDKGTFESTPLKLFTHVITHEFHHKGQIVSLSRSLGYTPIDTDIMR
jgi:uncharacterized damage-inducible protein DinB